MEIVKKNTALLKKKLNILINNRNKQTNYICSGSHPEFATTLINLGTCCQHIGAYHVNIGNTDKHLNIISCLQKYTNLFIQEATMILQDLQLIFVNAILLLERLIKLLNILSKIWKQKNLLFEMKI